MPQLNARLCVCFKPCQNCLKGDLNRSKRHWGLHCLVFKTPNKAHEVFVADIKGYRLKRSDSKNSCQCAE